MNRISTPTRAGRGWAWFFQLFLLISSVGFAQIESATISGSVKSSDGTSLSGVRISINAQQRGVFSDETGRYLIKVMPGKIEMTAQLPGFATVSRQIDINPNQNLTVDLFLEEQSRLLKTFVTTAGRYEQNVEELTVSLDVLTPDIIENKNTTSISDALQQVPGVSIVDNEPQLRGGSGFSFGAGSRAMILVDGLPVLSGDAGRATWAFLPIENLKQVEVIKGASSVLYGSAALSGVINLLSAYPLDTPQTSISFFSGIYNNPRNKAATYWGKDNPAYTGLSFFHSRKIKNLDFIIGGNAFNDEGYKTALIPDSSLKIPDGEYENRVRMNFGLRYHPEKVKGLSFGLNGNGMLSRSASALLWLNSDTGMYRAFPGTLAQTLQQAFYLDPFVEYSGAKGWKQSFRNRIFFLNNRNDAGKSNRSTVYYSEYQIQKNVKEGVLRNTLITGGLVHSQSLGTSELYKGNLPDNSGQSAISSNRNAAAYLQLERSFFNRLTLNVGGRHEHFRITSPRYSSSDSVNITSEGRPVFRAGAALKITKATFFRASFGQGYRFPTIAEKFIRTVVGPIPIYPNDSLQSESSFNAEFGLKQGFRIGQFSAYADVAVFRQQFGNNIEFNFGQFGNFFKDPLLGLGFASLNIGTTRVEGVELTLAGAGKIGKLGINVLVGHTYIIPYTLEPQKIYPIMDLAGELTYNKSGSDSTGNQLKYRFKHLFRGDIELSYGRWRVGASSRYNSFMENIDKIFQDLDELLPAFGQSSPGLRKYRAENNKGTWVADFRISYQLMKTLQVSFVCNNLFNAEYTLRPMMTESPRTTAIRINCSF